MKAGRSNVISKAVATTQEVLFTTSPQLLDTEIHAQALPNLWVKRVVFAILTDAVELSKAANSDGEAHQYAAQKRLN